MKIKNTKSISSLVGKSKSRRPVSKKGDTDELKQLMEMQREAFQAELDKSGESIISRASFGVKGLQKAYELQEEYKQAKTGVQSRYGKIAKAFGVTDEKGAAMLDKIFGKKIDEERLKGLREKFGIKSKEEKETAKKEKGEESIQRSKKRDEQLTKIEDLSSRIFQLISGVKDSVDGIANKLRASPAKAAPKSKKEERKAEKQAGVKYSKEANRYRDVKSGKFISEETARQKMNLRPGTATKVQKPSPMQGVLTAGEMIAAAPAKTAMASKVLKDETPTGLAQEDPTDKKLDKVSKDIKIVKDDVEDILDIFSLNKFYKLIGGAIGFAVPLLKKAVEFIWDIGKTGVKWVSELASNIWNNIKEFLTGIKLNIPEIMRAFEVDLPGINPFTIGPIGGFTFEPFSFLAKPSEGPDVISPPSKGEATLGVSGAAGAARPAGGGAVVSAPQAARSSDAAAGGGGRGGAFAAGGGARAAAGGGDTASKQGTSMPRAASSGPTRRLGPAAVGRGKVDASSAKNAALASAKKFGISGAHLAQFMAQLDHESGHFTRVEENLRYSAKRLMEIFPKYYKDPAVAAAEEYSPIAIANRVYGGRMGNNQEGDGYKYRGRGLIQLTGKDNYSRFGKIVGIDLVGNPEAAADLATAADIAAAFYKKQVIDRGIDGNDTAKVTKAINGGSIGLSDRIAKFEEYKKDPNALQATGPAPAANIPAASLNEAPPPAAKSDILIPSGGGGAALQTKPVQVAESSGGGGAASVPAAPQQAAPTATPVKQEAMSGQMVAQQTAEVSTAKEAAASKPAVIPVPTGRSGGGAQLSAPVAQKTDNSVKADVRFADNAFIRAISKDFAHPSTFTSVGPL